MKGQRPGQPLKSVEEALLEDYQGSNAGLNEPPAYLLCLLVTSLRIQCPAGESGWPDSLLWEGLSHFTCSPSRSLMGHIV